VTIGADEFDDTSQAATDELWARRVRAGASSYLNDGQAGDLDHPVPGYGKAGEN